MPRVLSKGVGMALLVYFAAGCSDGPNAVAPLRSPTQGRAAFVAPGGRPLERPDRLAAQISGFGGMYIANGVLNVYLTDMAEAASASRALDAELTQHGRAGLTVHLLKGAYRYAQLDSWRRSVLPAISSSQIVFSEVDEQANRVRIGVADLSAVAIIRQVLVQLPVPAEAFMIQIVPIPALYTTLQSRYRPLQAGFQFTGFWQQDGADQSAICTHGPNVTYEDAKYMVVNSHCTQNGSVGGLIGAAMYQPSVSFINFFGREVSDPPFTSSVFGCPSGQLCRYSDAALVKDTSTASWEIAAIGRPLGPPAQLPSLYGSLTIDAANPKFKLTNVLQSLFVGDTLYKVGRTTGWTKGVVVSTCRAITIGAYTRLCSGVVAGGAGHGDSGSPVFFKSSQGAYLLTGLLFGGLVGPDGVAGSEYDFSNWRWVNYELGITGTLDPITPPTAGCSPGGVC